MAKHEVEGDYLGVHYKIDHVEYGKHKDDAKGDAQNAIKFSYDRLAAASSSNTLQSMLQKFDDGEPVSDSVYASLSGSLGSVDADTIEIMVSDGKVSREEGDMLIVLRGLMQCGVDSTAELSSDMAKFAALNDSDQAYIVKQMSATDATLKADYQLSGGSEKGSDIRHQEVDNTGVTGTMLNISTLLSGMSEDTVTLLKQGDELGLGDSPLQDFIDQKEPDMSVLTEDQQTAWESIVARGNYANLTAGEATSLREIVAAEIDAVYGPGRFATTIDDDRASGLLTSINVSSDDQAKIAQMNAMLEAAPSLTDEQRNLLFAYFTSGGEIADSTDLDAAKTALTEDSSLTDADKAFLTDQLATRLIPDSGFDGLDNATIVHGLLNDDTISSAESNYVSQMRVDGTYVKPEDVGADDKPGDVGSGDVGSGDSGPVPAGSSYSAPYNTVDVTQANAALAVTDLNLQGKSQEETNALVNAMVDGTLNEVQITLLQLNLDGVSPTDRDVILSAIANSNADPTVLGGTATEEKTATAEQIDAAIANMEDLGLSNDDLTTLKQAMLTGTLTPEQGNLLLAHVADPGMAPENAAVVTTAVITSRAKAEEIYGAQWQEEEQDGEDYNKDNIVGSPWDFSPSTAKGLGLSDVETMDLASLMFQVMQGRCEALDSTVRSYAKTVQEKNDQLKTMNAATASIPTLSGDDTVDLKTVDPFVDPVTGKEIELLDYLKQQGIKLPTKDGSTTLNAGQLSSLRTSMDNAATSLSSDSQLAMTQLQQAMDKYSTSVTMLTNFLSKWYNMLNQIAAKLGQ